MKVLNEIKELLKKYPKAGGVGYFIAPTLMKLAIDNGLLGYDEALNRWLDGNLLTAEVVEGEQATIKSLKEGFFVCWEGPNLIHINNTIQLGIEKTIQMIEAKQELLKKE